jgi:hypothetical protein
MGSFCTRLVFFCFQTLVREVFFLTMLEEVQAASVQDGHGGFGFLSLMGEMVLGVFFFFLYCRNRESYSRAWLLN